MVDHCTIALSPKVTALARNQRNHLRSGAWANPLYVFLLISLPHSSCSAYPSPGKRANVVRRVRAAGLRVEFYTARAILPGEELLFDYGKDYWAAIGVTPLD